MILVKHETNTVVGAIDRTVIVDAFAEAVTLGRDVKVVHETLGQLMSDEIDNMEALDILEDYLDIDCSKLTLLARMRVSADIMVNKYLDRLISTVKAYVNSYHTAIDCLFNVTKEELEGLQKLAYDIIAGLVFFRAYEFDLLHIVTSSEAGDLIIDEIANSYCERSGETPISLAEEAQDDMKNFYVRFDVFDAFRELEDEFMDIMGPSVVGIDESYLTKELVEAVIAGSMTPEALVEVIQAEVRAQEGIEV